MKPGWTRAVGTSGGQFLPDLGQELRGRGLAVHTLRMLLDPALVAQVAASTGLSPSEAARVVDDVLSFHAVPVAELVRRRHRELKTHGARNAAIFARIATELPDVVVAAPRLTERQLRRLVYG